MDPIITTAGAYADISSEMYHRAPNLLPGPSLSATGAKTLAGTKKKSPFHFWFDSPMNPNRPEEKEAAPFNIGRAGHDALLLPGRWAKDYHILPKGFDSKATKKQAEWHAERDAAIDDGLTVLKFDEAMTVEAVVAAIQGNSLAMATLTNGVAEETLAWQDARTGVWLRARPDFRPQSIIDHRAVMAVPDVKIVAASHASPDGFSKAINDFGYHQAAALYSDGIKAVYGHYPTHWVHVVVEKDPPHCVALYELPGEDMERGRVLNRRAIDTFARCLDTGKWPGYSDIPTQVGLPVWSRMRCDDLDPNEFAWSTAA